MAVTVANIVEHTKEVVNAVRAKSDSVILFYSCGKDSIALLDMVAPCFRRVVCVYMYFVKGLEHTDRFIRYSKTRYSNVEFLEIPHWNLTWILREGVYCQPNPNVRTMTLKDVDEAVRLKTGIQWSMYGMKQSDSLNRKLMLRSEEYDMQAVNRKTNKAYPLSLWNNKDVMQYITANNLPQPVVYTKKKRSSGLGFDIDVFLYLKDSYPQDLERIFRQFPHSRQILYEYEYKQRTGKAV